MSRKPSVLVVAPTLNIATSVLAWLIDAGYAPVVVRSFAAAKPQLDHHPSLLVSEVRLAEYNGLHLALRAQSMGVPAVLIGSPDPVLEREAAQMGAAYLPPPVNGQELLSTIQRVTLATAATQAWRHETRNVSFISAGSRPRTPSGAPSHVRAGGPFN